MHTASQNERYFEYGMDGVRGGGGEGGDGFEPLEECNCRQAAEVDECSLGWS